MSGRKFFIGGNWKCNGTVSSVETLTNGVAASVDATLAEKVEVVIGVPFVYLSKVQALLDAHPNGKNIAVSAQNAWTKSGAYTGEVHVGMLVDNKIPFVILGHKSNTMVADKTKVALNAGLKVIACIGETESQRIANETEKVVSEQLKAISDVLTKEDWKNVVIAYEPVWAIGTGKTATPEQAQEVHQFIRQWLEKNIDKNVSDATRILYGGSVNNGNCNALAKKVDIDGFLVGGASLDSSKFEVIIKSVSEKN
ncbi:Triosephosphate isomerase [Entamoeba marina]